MELWKKCEINQSYEVSSLGNVRSVDRIITRIDGQTRRYKGKVMSQNTDRYGYSNVYLSLNNKNTRMRVHRLVAIAFLLNPECKEQVNHKDGNKSNNVVDNLEWSTNSENQKHAIDSGLKIAKTGSGATNFTGAVQAFDKLGNLVATMSGNKEMKENGFDYRLVSAVLLGKRKSHKDCTFVKLDKVI